MKREQQQRGAQQPDRKIGAEFGEPLAIRLHALIGILADFAGKAQQISAFRREPLVQEVMGQPFTQTNLQHFADPGFGDDQGQKYGDDQNEDADLHDEGVGIGAAPARCRKSPFQLFNRTWPIMLRPIATTMPAERSQMRKRCGEVASARQSVLSWRKIV